MHMHRRHDEYHSTCSSVFSICRNALFVLLLFCCLLKPASGYDHLHAGSLRKETADIFYHGYENYLLHAFPEDELRPLSCTPLTRDRDNPAHIEVNDALGNYSLTLIDSLSTLAILASSPSDSRRNKALDLFQNGVKLLVDQYGDGTAGESGQGRRARGFDLDSKVQVFETAIRGLGGLLSAHLFAVGDLPIRGYTPTPSQVAYAQSWQKQHDVSESGGIQWQNDMRYDGQLLRLAYDLGERLIPAFWTSTGIPYPRVNLRSGIPFYANSPHNYDPARGQCSKEQRTSSEITETCSAGAGSLVLEFTVLSRLTGDPRFEQLAKRAFWSIWSRRSDIDLIGAGIDAETGLWINSYTGIGAGIDSFFEYAFKSHILLSNDYHPHYAQVGYRQDPRTLFEPLSDYEQSPAAFLQAWEIAHKAIQRNLLRGSNYQHPHYIQVDLMTGAARAFWIDALSAYYPGLLTLAGHVEEAIEAHLLATALWTRFSALPERWNLVTGGIEGGLGWWVGRPEFIESNYYLYRATEDPWYKFVAEMALRDIKRRCWTRCGWAGIQNVLTGEKADRMESFFLGETAKYLFLTFDDDHPLNHLDAPFVFSTEGHPLLVPPSAGKHSGKDNAHKYFPLTATCPVKPPSVPFSISSTAARGDVYHAASLARLHHMPERNEAGSRLGEHALDHPSITTSDITSPSNFTHFPWTLPMEMIPRNATSTTMQIRPTFDITFPNIPNAAGQPFPPLQRVKDGILVNFLGGLRLGMVQDVPTMHEDQIFDGYRIHAVNNIQLGKDEKIFLPHDKGLGTVDPTDPNFTRIRDTSMLDLVVEIATSDVTAMNQTTPNANTVTEQPAMIDSGQNVMKSAWNSIVSQIAGLVHDAQPMPLSFPLSQKPNIEENKPQRHYVPAIAPTGIGAAPIPDWIEAPSLKVDGALNIPLGWNTVFATDDLCERKLPVHVVNQHQVLIVKRGHCSFSTKLSNIPLFAPSPSSLQLIVIVSYGTGRDEVDDHEDLVRPLLDQTQMTNTGLPRQYPLPMVMVAGGQRIYEALKNASGMGVKRRYSVRAQGIPITNLVIT